MYAEAIAQPTAWMNCVPRFPEMEKKLASRLEYITGICRPLRRSAEFEYTWHIMSRIGQSRAMDLLMTGRVIDATEAERIGYLARLWPRSSYEAELQAFLEELASGPTTTYAAWKLTVNRAVLQELDSYTDYERALADVVRQTEDHAEGRLSFREKRLPKYVGR